MGSFSFREIYYFLGSLNQTVLFIGSVCAGVKWVIGKITAKKK